MNLMPVYAEVAVDGDDDHNVFANLWEKNEREREKKKKYIPV